MIFIALGANLEHPLYGEPLNTLRAAVDEMKQSGLFILKQSSWYKTAPVPVSDQPWFVNAVIEIETNLEAAELLNLLHAIERKFGRVREIQWEARILDLDLLAYNSLITENRSQLQGSVVPHPRMHERGFVMAPLCEIAPNWRHPVLRKSATEIRAEILLEAEVEVLPHN